jgi:hypothetical protein
MTTHLGWYNTSGTRTRVRLAYSTHSKDGGNIAPLSAIDAADIRIYRAADGAAFSATERSSSAGITSTSPFDSLTGFHAIDIDLTDNTDSGFYAAGYLYAVVLAPDTETIDGQTITGVVLGYFEIGVAPANVTQFGGSNGTFSSGRPEVNTTHIAGTAVTAASGVPEVKVQSIANNAITANAIASDAITAAKIATDAIDADSLKADAVTEIAAGILTAALADVYAANGVAPTLQQAVMAIHQMLMAFEIVSTEIRVKKLDGSSSAFNVTTDSATAPTEAIRS